MCGRCTGDGQHASAAQVKRRAWLRLRSLTTPQSVPHEHGGLRVGDPEPILIEGSPPSGDEQRDHANLAAFLTQLYRDLTEDPLAMLPSTGTARAGISEHTAGLLAGSKAAPVSDEVEPDVLDRGILKRDTQGAGLPPLLLTRGVEWFRPRVRSG